MGHSFSDVGGYGDFTVTKSNPSGTTVRFTASDATGLLSSPKLIRAVLCDAIQQWIDSERADLNANGDTDVTGEDTRYPGDGFSKFTFNVSGKYAQVTLKSLTNISATGTITVSIPYSDAI